LWSLARYIHEHHGAPALERIAREARISPDELDGQSHWGSCAQFDGFLLGARSLMTDDDEFRRACVYRLREGYGPLRYLLWAVAPGQIYTQATRTMPLISTISRYEIISSGQNRMHARYTTQRAESRLMCISRQAQFAALPTLWGLPAAQLKESSCVADGDPHCDYHLRWFESRRWMPAIIGTFGGAVIFGLLFGLENMHAALGFSLFAGAIGLILENRRANLANIAVGSEMNEALLQVAREDAAARREILALHQRQWEWSRAMEKQVEERTGTLRQVVQRIEHLREERETTLRGFSHDLRNPLCSLKIGSGWLQDHAGDFSEPARAVIDDQVSSVARIEVLLEELMNVATSEEGLKQISAQELDVTELAARLRARLHALVLGKNIRIEVVEAREAPAKIVTDLLLFDRVIDNLLTNAGKYTERGSIMIEVGGTPGFLTIKVSDTGRGIGAEKINSIFEPGGSEERLRAPNSYGVGLSVVVRLLAQIGGRLEVLSRLGQGTTFWAHFPESLVSAVPSEPPTKHDELVQKVVTIRRL
jgi:signal transduction histidine kinase